MDCPAQVYDKKENQSDAYCCSNLPVWSVKTYGGHGFKLLL